LDSTDFLGEKEAARIGRNFLASEKQFGENPDIFYYQIKRSENLDNPKLIIRMVFYGGIEVILLSVAKPNHSKE